MRPPANRDEPWFVAVYTDHYPDLVRYGLRRLSDMDEATGLAQDVFAIAWRRRADVPDHSLPWLYGVARRVLANRWRARRTNPTMQPVADPAVLPRATNAVPPDAFAAVADIYAALARMSDTDQEILRLIGWEQLTVAEAARVLGCSGTAAKVRLHRARRRLAAALATPVSTPSSPRRNRNFTHV